MFISIDNLSPIIHAISKKNKVLLLNLNVIQDHSSRNNPLINFLLKKKKIKYLQSFTFYNLKFIFIIFLIFILKKLPEKIVKRGYNYWYFIRHNLNVYSKNSLMTFIKKNNVKSITMDASLPRKKIIFLKNIANEINIPLIMIPSGLHAGKVYFDIKDFDKIDYFLSPNTLGFEKINTKKIKKFVQMGSLRYTDIWINYLHKIYKIKAKKYKRKIHIGFFIKYNELYKKKFDSLLSSLNKIKNVKIRINNKPQDIYPLCNKNKLSFSASEIISWSDIIVSFAGSIMIEPIILNKPVILSEFLCNRKKKFGNHFENYDLIIKKNTNKGVLNYIKEKKYINFFYKKKEKSKFLKDFITEANYTKLSNKYMKFYSSLLNEH
tara:strand:- start:622 stop:1755 length:1134 start_codon:yes stop_codon:yes gene_type:complete